MRELMRWGMLRRLLRLEVIVSCTFVCFLFCVQMQKDIFCEKLYVKVRIIGKLLYIILENIFLLLFQCVFNWSGSGFFLSWYGFCTDPDSDKRTRTETLFSVATSLTLRAPIFAFFKKIVLSTLIAICKRSCMSVMGMYYTLYKAVHMVSYSTYACT